MHTQRYWRCARLANIPSRTFDILLPFFPSQRTWIHTVLRMYTSGLVRDLFQVCIVILDRLSILTPLPTFLSTRHLCIYSL